MATGGLSIKLRCASWQQLATIYQRDLSRGTMFLKATHPPAVGTQVRIDLTLPSSSVIVLTGVVDKHVQDPTRGQGVELKLAPIPAGSVWLIESALASQRRTEGEGEPPAPPPQKSQPVASADGDDVVEAESELLKALSSEADSLKKLNPFLVLGVTYSANDQEVRGAFGELTKRYHPDRFARYESTELRAIAAEIFILIRDAYRKLGDAAGRASALAAIGKPITVPAPRATPAARKTPAAGNPVTPPVGKSTPGGGLANPVVEERPTPKPIATTDAPVRRSEPAMAAPAFPGLPDVAQVEELVEAGRYDEALQTYRMLVKRLPGDRVVRAGIELCEGLLALNARDRLEAAQRFEAALEIDPSNERAARELAEMRRQATNERKGQLSRLMGKKE